MTLNSWMIDDINLSAALKVLPLSDNTLTGIPLLAVNHLKLRKKAVVFISVTKSMWTGRQHFPGVQGACEVNPCVGERGFLIYSQIREWGRRWILIQLTLESLTENTTFFTSCLPWTTQYLVLNSASALLTSMCFILLWQSLTMSCVMGSFFSRRMGNTVSG